MPAQPPWLPVTSRYFELSVVLILSVTAVAKALSAVGHAPILYALDPLLGIPNRLIFCLAALIEAAVVGLLIFSTRHHWKYGAVIWLCGVFVLYRLGVSMADSQKPCPCLGTLTDSLHISPVLADRLLGISIGYMLLGSLSLLLLHLLRKPANSARSSHTIAPERSC